MEGQQRGHHGQKYFSRPTDPPILGEPQLLATPRVWNAGMPLLLPIELTMIVSVGSVETGVANPCALPFLRALIQ